MNFKRRKTRENRHNKKALNSKSLQCYEYGNQVAKEVVLRKEFSFLKLMMDTIISTESVDEETSGPCLGEYLEHTKRLRR